MPNNLIIRPIQPKDNPHVATLIRKVLEDFGVPKVGTAYADASLDRMYETYDLPRNCYFVIDDDTNILGGAGIAPLANYEGNICELQKMYFLEAARGKGLGARMMHICLEKAKEYGYEKCYLETMSYMKDAQKLYQKTGFHYLETPMGNTGHYACPVWMLKEL